MDDSFFEILKKKKKESTISSVADTLFGGKKPSAAMMEATHGIKIGDTKTSAKNVEKELEELLEIFSKTKDINDNSVREKLVLTQDLIFKPKNVVNRILAGLENIDRMPSAFKSIFYEQNRDGSASETFRRYNNLDSDDIFRELLDTLPNTSRTRSTLSEMKYRRAVAAFKNSLNAVGKVTLRGSRMSDLEKFNQLMISLSDWMEVEDEEELENIGDIYETLGDDAFERDSVGQLSEALDMVENMWKNATPEIRVKFRKMLTNADILNHGFPVQNGERRKIDLTEEI